MPNFFGSQRFGWEGGNVAKGREAFLGKGPRRDPWLTKLLISAYQSHLFNRYLVSRIEQGLFEHLLDGDVCKKAETGGMFEVQDAAVASSSAISAARSPSLARSTVRNCGRLRAQRPR